MNTKLMRKDICHTKLIGFIAIAIILSLNFITKCILKIFYKTLLCNEYCIIVCNDIKLNGVFEVEKWVFSDWVAMVLNFIFMIPDFIINFISNVCKGNDAVEKVFLWKCTCRNKIINREKIFYYIYKINELA